MELTESYLKTQLHYDPDTGLFTRVVSSGKAMRGDRADKASSAGYRRITIGGIRYPAHRLAFLYMTGSQPLNHTDHINGIRHDNRWHNLRSVTNHENRKNMKLYATSSTGIGGVTYDKSRGRWMAYVKVDGKMSNIGRFTTIFEAAAARISSINRLGFSARHGLPVEHMI